MKECLSEDVLQLFIDGELKGVHLENAVSHLAGCETCTISLQELEKEANFVTAALAAEFDGGVPTEQLHRRIEAAIAGLNVVSPVHSVAPVQSWRAWLGKLSAAISLTPQRGFAFGGLAAVVLFAAIASILMWRDVPNEVNSPKSESVASDSTPRLDVLADERGGTPVPVGSTSPTPRVGGPVSRPSQVAKRNLPTLSKRSSSPAVAEVKLLPGERSYLKTIAALDNAIKSGDTTMRPALQAEYERNLALVDRAIATTRSAAKRNPNNPDAADFMFAAYQSKVDLLSTIADARVFNRPR